MRVYKSREQVVRRLLAGTALALFGFNNAEAGLISSCGNYSTDSVLNGDITMPSNRTQACVIMEGGKDLNLAGFKIKCTGSCPQYPAVECHTGSNNHVNSVIYGGTIEGNFTIGVNHCGTVRDTKIDGPTDGIKWSVASNGKDFYRNVIQLGGSTGTGIDMKLEEDADTIHDNRIDGGAVGMKIVGRTGAANGPRLYQNVIRGFSSVGIQNTDSTYFRLEDTVVVDGLPGADALSIQSGNATRTDLVCPQDALCNCQLDVLQAPAAGCFSN